jgi:hypothetical protein
MEVVCRFGFMLKKQELQELLTNYMKTYGNVSNMYKRTHDNPWEFVCDYHCQEDIDSDTKSYQEEGFEVKIELEEYKCTNLIEEIDMILGNLMKLKDINVSELHENVLLFHSSYGFYDYYKCRFFHISQDQSDFTISQQDYNTIMSLKNTLQIDDDPEWHFTVG